MNAFKTAATTASIGALGLASYAIASPLMIPLGIGVFVIGAISQINNQK